MQASDLQGDDNFEEFVEMADGAKVREVVLTAVGDTQPDRVGPVSFVLRPIVRIRCTIYLKDTASDDPYASKPFVWEVVRTPRSVTEEREAVDRIANALRSRGFAVSFPARAYA